MEFKIHDSSSAPEASAPVLEEAKKKYGFSLNLFGILAESPPALSAYWTISALLEANGALDAKQQQIVMLAVSEANACEYCVAAHSTVAEMSDVSEEVISRLREGKDLEDPQDAALVRFTRTLMEKEGWVSDSDQADFLEAGFTPRQALDVITILALKTLSNYTNHLSEPPLDEAFREKAWSKQ